MRKQNLHHTALTQFQYPNSHNLKPVISRSTKRKDQTTPNCHTLHSNYVHCPATLFPSKTTSKQEKTINHHKRSHTDITTQKPTKHSKLTNREPSPPEPGVMKRSDFVRVQRHVISRGVLMVGSSRINLHSTERTRHHDRQHHRHRHPATITSPPRHRTAHSPPRRSTSSSNPGARYSKP